MKQKSNRQRRTEIHEKRRQRAQNWQEQLAEAATVQERRLIAERAARQGAGVIMADAARLAAHNNSYALPDYYIDQAFQCAACGTQEIWTAKQQKWWYEVALGSINSTARYCRNCRRARHLQREQSKLNHPLEEQQNTLRTWAKQKPCPDAWAAVNAALQSKWWPARVVAIQTVGEWWGRNHDTELLIWLRRWVDEAPAGSIYAHTWAAEAARAAYKAIARHIRASDISWLLPWLLQNDTPHGDIPNGWIWELLRAVPTATLLQIIDSPAHRKALYEDPILAPLLLKMLICCDEHTPDHTLQWLKLARHATASPLLSSSASQWLHWRLQRLEASIPNKPSAKRHKT